VSQCFGGGGTGKNKGIGKKVGGNQSAGAAGPPIPRVALPWRGVGILIYKRDNQPQPLGGFSNHL